MTVPFLVDVVCTKKKHQFLGYTVQVCMCRHSGSDQICFSLVLHIFPDTEKCVGFLFYSATVDTGQDTAAKDWVEEKRWKPPPQLHNPSLLVQLWKCSEPAEPAQVADLQRPVAAKTHWLVGQHAHLPLNQQPQTRSEVMILQIKMNHFNHVLF